MWLEQDVPWLEQEKKIGLPEDSGSNYEKREEHM